MDKHEIIRRDSEAYQVLYRKIHETFQHRDEGPVGFKVWEAACDAFHRFDSPMFELVTDEGLARLSAGDAELVDWATAYLETDPFHFRSGYYKSWFIRRLKRLALTPRSEGASARGCSPRFQRFQACTELLFATRSQPPITGFSYADLIPSGVAVSRTPTASTAAS